MVNGSTMLLPVKDVPSEVNAHIAVNAQAVIVSAAFFIDFLLSERRKSLELFISENCEFYFIKYLLHLHFIGLIKGLGIRTERATIRLVEVLMNC